MDELPAVLERLRGNIDDERWRRRIIYVQAMHALWPDWNESAGRQELRKLGTLGTDDDVEILQLYLDLFEDSLGFAEKDALIDRILNESESLTDQLHYKGSKAVLYLTISDFKKADAELVEAVALARARLDEKNFTRYQRYRSHRHWVCWDGCARTTRCCMRQWRCTKGCLPTKTIGPRGRAGLLAWLGETYRLLKEWGKAEAAYARAFDAEPAGIHRVFLSECLLRQSKIGEAAETLASVKIEELHPAEQVDYAFGFATLAIETNERAKLEQAKQVLKSVKVPDPYFRERRDAFLLKVQEALASGGSPALAQRTTGLLDTVRSASPYLILKPTFMGIGIDIGKIFEDLAKRRQRRAEKRDAAKKKPD